MSVQLESPRQSLQPGKLILRNSRLTRCQQLTSWLTNPFVRKRTRPTLAPLGSIELFEDRVLLTQYSVLSNADSGPDTLRQAILDANANAGADTIVFNLAAESLVISPLTPLPAITDTVTLDGSSQPGFAGTPLVVLTGALLPDQTYNPGLEINSVNSVVKSLVVQSFHDGEGILIGGFDTTGVSGNHIEGCYVGTNAAGASAAQNGNGIRIANGATNNVIGGTTAGQGNLVSGNRTYGIVIEGAGTDGNVVQGNSLGTSADKTFAISNGYGVSVAGGPANTTIGGLVAGAGNLISGNVDYGISLFNATGTLVQGNLIGTNAAGTAALGDYTDVAGISVTDGSHGNTIGGTTAAARNLIAGVSGTGIHFEGAETTGNFVQGNYLGVNITGTAAIPGTNDNIFLEGTPGNVIGGLAAGAGNLISGADRHGIVIFGSTAIENTVLGNRIGTNAAGTAAIPNGTDGIRIDGASNNLIGGPEEGATNVLSGNAENGITLTNAGAFANFVEGNYIGVQADGVSPLPNGINGVELSFGAGNSQIGGSFPGEYNVIAYNASRGVVITHASLNGTSIAGNSIHSNGEYEIDLNNDFRTPNDALDADGGPNYLQNFPVLNSAISANGELTIRGTLSSSPNTVFALCFFASETNDENGFSQGELYIGRTEITSDQTGVAEFSVILPVGVQIGYVISATATSQGTSEFSDSIAVTSTPTTSPILSLPAFGLHYELNAPPLQLAPTATVVDSDSPNLGGGRLVVAFNPKGQGKQLLAIRSQGTGAGLISVADKSVLYGGTVIGTFTGGKGKKALTVKFNSDATIEAVQQLVRNITYQNNSKKLKSNTTNIRMFLVDGDGHSSTTTNLQITS